MTAQATSRIWRSLLGFTLAQVALVFGAMWLLQRYVWTDAASVAAVQASAWMAIGVQTVTFAIVKLTARHNVFAGWGLGMLVRFATLAFWAFLGIKALALPAGPALLSLVLFYFVSTLVEPLFLNA